MADDPDPNDETKYYELEPVDGQKSLELSDSVFDGSGDPNDKSTVFGMKVEGVEDIELGPYYTPPSSPAAASKSIAAPTTNASHKPPRRSNRPVPKAYEVRGSGGGEKGAAYSGNSARQKHMRKVGGGSGNPAVQAEAKAARVWKIAIAGVLLITGAVGVVAVNALRPVVKQMNATDYRPMDGILTSYNSKPLMATLDQNGQLCFVQLEGYASRAENGVIQFRYDKTVPVDFADALPRFDERLPQLEWNIMNGPLTATTGVEELKRRKIFSLLRAEILSWRAEQEKQKQAAPKKDGEEPKSKQTGLLFLPQQTMTLAFIHTR